jgi:UDP-N-acetylglucosamine 2-epimerase
MSQGRNPFGDGRASYRIAESLSRWAQGEPRILEEADEFGGAATLDEIAA